MKYALITGGSRGIGRAVCIKMAQMGYQIIINYVNNTTEAEKTLALVRENGQDGEMLRFDVGQMQQTREALDAWQQAHPDDYIEVVVNNAGIRRDNVMALMPAEDWSSVLNTTLNGFFYLTRRVVKGMMTKRYGRIVNVVSLSGIKGMPGQTNYSAAKAAVIGATKALAQEVAPRKVTVNAVAPGFIATDMTKDLDEGELKKLIPAGRFGKPEEVAALVAFLASKEAAYITGEVVNINGGLYT